MVVLVLMVVLVVVVAAGLRTMQRLGAPSQVLQGLQEGAACPLLLQWRGTFLLHLCDLRKCDRLRFEASLPWPAGAALAPGRPLGHRHLLGELLSGRGQEVRRQEVVEARGLHGHRTHSSH